MDIIQSMKSPTGRQFTLQNSSEKRVCLINFDRMQLFYNNET